MATAVNTKSAIQICQWEHHPYNRDGETCDRNAHRLSDLCSDHVKTKNLIKAQAKAGIPINAGPSKKRPPPRGKKRPKLPGENEKAIRELRKWIEKADEDAVERFSAQLTIAMTLAREIDNGDTGRASQYRQVVDKIYDRVDKVYGTKNLDIIARMQQMIDDNAKQRVKEGWDA